MSEIFAVVYSQNGKTAITRKKWTNDDDGVGIAELEEGIINGLIGNMVNVEAFSANRHQKFGDLDLIGGGNTTTPHLVAFRLPDDTTGTYFVARGFRHLGIATDDRRACFVLQTSQEDADRLFNLRRKTENDEGITRAQLEEFDLKEVAFSAAFAERDDANINGSGDAADYGDAADAADLDG